MVASTGEEKLFLDSPYAFVVTGGRAITHFTLGRGESAWFVVQYNTHVPFGRRELERYLKITINYWQLWAHKCGSVKCIFSGPWHDLVIRSSLVLKLLTHGETGAIAAAATTSLPETIGGQRNWDYRFNWIRDSVFTAQALYSLGLSKEAKALLNWYKRLYRGRKVSDIKIMYGLHGESNIREVKLHHLAGYRNSRPVRIGNAAVFQTQLDIYGELLNLAYEVGRYGESISSTEWQLIKKVVDHVCKAWNTKDSGIWEVRSKPRDFVYSKVMCWVAVDRGIKIAERKGFKAPLELWKKVRDNIRRAVLTRGYDKKLHTFIRAFGSRQLDAANLLIPAVGFLPYTDKRVIGTINATLKYLTKKGFVYRYRTRDSLRGEEGAFLLCTFWLIDALALSGRVNKAEEMLKNVVKHVSPLGLLAEEIDPRTGNQRGNFPQAFSHVGFINCALSIGVAKSKVPLKPTLLRHLTNRLSAATNFFVF